MPRMSIIGIIFFCTLQSFVGCIIYPDAGNEIRMELPFHSDNDCIIDYNGYTISYDETARIPSWVAYELTAEEANGTIGRSGKNFRPDERVKAVQADNYDYWQLERAGEQGQDVGKAIRQCLCRHRANYRTESGWHDRLPRSRCPRRIL